MTETVRVARCGTPSGYQKHQRHRETPCDACVRAKSDYDKRWREATDRQKRDRLSAQAQSRALSILRGRYEAEYAELYAAERDRLFAAAGIGAPDA